MGDPIPSSRAQALLAYFWQIAGDPRVRGGRTGDAIFDAVVACMREDWVEVMAVVLRNGKRIIREKAPTVAGAMAGDLVGRALKWFEDGIGKGSSR